MDDIEPIATSGPMGFERFAKEQDSSKAKEVIVEIASSSSTSQEGSDFERDEVQSHNSKNHDDSSMEMETNDQDKVNSQQTDQHGQNSGARSREASPDWVHGESRASSPTPMEKIPMKRKKKSGDTGPEQVPKKGKHANSRGDTKTTQENQKRTPPAKTNLAAMYVENKEKEAEMRLKIVKETKQWKMAEIAEARLGEQEVRLAERRIAKTTMKAQIIIAGCSQNKSIEEITAMIKLLDD